MNVIECAIKPLVGPEKPTRETKTQGSGFVIASQLVGTH